LTEGNRPAAAATPALTPTSSRRFIFFIAASVALTHLTQHGLRDRPSPEPARKSHCHYLRHLDRTMSERSEPKGKWRDPAFCQITWHRRAPHPSHFKESTPRSPQQFLDSHDKIEHGA